jgi:hypothetical protein
MLSFFYFREYLQRERAKYKDLLNNAQYDFSGAKKMTEKENDLRLRQDANYHQYLEEKNKLMSRLTQVL